VYRVTVRGRFGTLTDQARRYLVGAQAEHDLFVSAYTVEGTFTYDRAVAFFNLRYEVRLASDLASDQAASAVALAEAELFLRTMDFTHRGLKVGVVDASAIWEDAARSAQTQRDGR
jgi:Family of unknown function (DUF6204)